MQRESLLNWPNVGVDRDWNQKCVEKGYRQVQMDGHANI